ARSVAGATHRMHDSIIQVCDRQSRSKLRRAGPPARWRLPPTASAARPAKTPGAWRLFAQRAAASPAIRWHGQIPQPTMAVKGSDYTETSTLAKRTARQREFARTLRRRQRVAAPPPHAETR